MDSLDMLVSKQHRLDLFRFDIHTPSRTPHQQTVSLSIAKVYCTYTRYMLPEGELHCLRSKLRRSTWTVLSGALLLYETREPTN